MTQLALGAAGIPTPGAPSSSFASAQFEDEHPSAVMNAEIARLEESSAAESLHTDAEQIRPPSRREFIEQHLDGREWIEEQVEASALEAAQSEVLQTLTAIDREYVSTLETISAVQSDYQVVDKGLHILNQEANAKDNAGRPIDETQADNHRISEIKVEVGDAYAEALNSDLPNTLESGFTKQVDDDIPTDEQDGVLVEKQEIIDEWTGELKGKSPTAEDYENLANRLEPLVEQAVEARESVEEVVDGLPEIPAEIEQGTLDVEGAAEVDLPDSDSDFNTDIKVADLDLPEIEITMPDVPQVALPDVEFDWETLAGDSPFGLGGLSLDSGLGLDGDFSGEIPGSELAENLYDRRDQIEDLYEAIDQGRDWQTGELGLELIGDLTENAELGEAGEWIGNLGDFEAALASGDDWTAVDGALDLTEDIGQWADWDSGTMKHFGTAAGVVGGISTLANLDDAFSEGDLGGIVEMGSMLATTVGADALASSIDGFVPYAGMISGFAGGDPLGSALSTMGAQIGQTLIPIPVAGAIVGSVVGSALGGLLGGDPPPPPEAEATLGVDDHGRFYVESATDAHGGNAGSMSVAAQRAADSLNGLLDATGGRVLDPNDLQGIEIGYDGEGLYAGDRHFDSVAEAVGHMVETRLEGVAIEGGDLHVKRALYRQIEGGDFDIADAGEAIETARAYSQYRDNADQIERLAETEAVAEELAAHGSGELDRDDLSDEAALVLDARETEAEAQALGLDQPHRFDQASRLNEALEANGIDLDEVAVTDLQIADLHGELVVAVRDPENPDTPIRDLPHAVVDSHAADFDTAMLYLDDGTGWNLEELLDLTGVEPGAGAVDLEQALIERFDADTDHLHMGSAGDDSLHAGAGDDTLIGGQGADTLAGGRGEDTADYSDGTTGVAASTVTAIGDAAAIGLVAGFAQSLLAGNDETALPRAA